MNVQMAEKTNVIQTPLVLTLKDLMSASVVKDTRETAENAQVGKKRIIGPFSVYARSRFACV